VKDPLTNPAWSALTGPHAAFAERIGAAARYPGDVSPFTALAGPDGGAAAWADAAALLGPGGRGGFAYVPSPPPADWAILHHVDVHQMIDDGVAADEMPEAIRLTAADVPEMLGLIARTDPGPFLPRTVELGTYLGIRRDGRLIAMAGERLHPVGHTEISAVCTDPEFRGQGLAGRLVRAVAAIIIARDETPFLHVSPTNTNAVRLYEKLGFRLNRTMKFVVVTAPAG
jgi:ribosomal protein S18 acetylase RimI-like enzyme